MMEHIDQHHISLVADFNTSKPPTEQVVFQRQQADPSTTTTTTTATTSSCHVYPEQRQQRVNGILTTSPEERRRVWRHSPTVLAMLTGNTMGDCEQVKMLYAECQASHQNHPFHSDRICEVANHYYSLCTKGYITADKDL